jgi:hypothetical protein
VRALPTGKGTGGFSSWNFGKVAYNSGTRHDNGLELDREAALWYYNLGFRAKGFPALDGLKVLC